MFSNYSGMKIIVSNSVSPYLNLAAEEYLFSQTDEDVLFLYINESSVILGCNQALSNEVNVDFCAENNIKILRRLSGGGTVYHDNGNLNYSFITNKMDASVNLNSQFLLPIVTALHQLNVPVIIGKRNDLWLNQHQKVSGTASHIGKFRQLQHGTLLYDTNLQFLTKALSPLVHEPVKNAIPSVRSSVQNIRKYLTDKQFLTVDTAHFFVQLQLQLLELLGPKFIETLEINIAIQKLAEEKYASKWWTYKK